MAENEVDISHLNRQVVTIAERGKKLGWTVRVVQGGHILLCSPVGNVTRPIDGRSWNDRDLRALRHKVITYADPELLRLEADQARRTEVVDVGTVSQPHPVAVAAAKTAITAENPIVRTVPYFIHEGEPWQSESATAQWVHYADGTRHLTCKGCGWGHLTVSARSIGSHYAGVDDSLHPRVTSGQSKEIKSRIAPEPVKETAPTLNTNLADSSPERDWDPVDLLAHTLAYNRIRDIVLERDWPTWDVDRVELERQLAAANQENDRLRDILRRFKDAGVAATLLTESLPKELLDAID